MPFGAVLICDDIRRDTNNKDIIIGVYSSDIVVPQVPAWLPLSVYLEYLPTATGEQEFYIQIGLASSGLLEGYVKFNISEINSFSIPISGIQMMIDAETDFVVNASTDHKQSWIELKRKSVKIGKLQSVVPMPSVVGSPPGNT